MDLILAPLLGVVSGSEKNIQSMQEPSGSAFHSFFASESQDSDAGLSLNSERILNADDAVLLKRGSVGEIFVGAIFNDIMNKSHGALQIMDAPWILTPEESVISERIQNASFAEASPSIAVTVSEDGYFPRLAEPALSKNDVILSTRALVPENPRLGGPSDSLRLFAGDFFPPKGPKASTIPSLVPGTVSTEIGLPVGTPANTRAGGSSDMRPSSDIPLTLSSGYARAYGSATSERPVASAVPVFAALGEGSGKSAHSGPAGQAGQTVAVNAPSMAVTPLPLEAALSHEKAGPFSEFSAELTANEDKLRSTTTLTSLAKPGIEGQAPKMIARQIVENARSAGDGSIEVMLEPVELGRLRISMTPADGVMTVSLSIERDDTADLVRRSLDLLVEEFEAVGYADVDIDFASSHFGQGDQAHDGEGPGDTQIVEHVGEVSSDAVRPIKIDLTNGIDIRI
ncbi:MAG: flagellar hook-length control protein FliK [Pseudomonadota bacterium]